MAGTITFSWWGNRDGRIAMPRRVRDSREPWESRLDLLARAIERRNPGLHVCASTRHGQEIKDGDVAANTYELTLGRPAPGGGYHVMGTVWVRIEGRTLRA